ncbi:MAG: cold shock protein [Acidimicrobiaceae bacterium]
MRGTVVAFDDAAGLGEVTADDGSTYPFHCTAIGDGTRTIEVGACVDFELEPRLGRYEASALWSCT